MNFTGIELVWFVQKFYPMPFGYTRICKFLKSFALSDGEESNPTRAESCAPPTLGTPRART